MELEWEPRTIPLVSMLVEADRDSESANDGGSLKLPSLARLLSSSSCVFFFFDFFPFFF